MKESLKKYHGIFPAFYACYDDTGAVSPDRIERFTDYLIRKGVNGLYVGGSSGECIYQTLEERKLVLEHVMRKNTERTPLPQFRLFTLCCRKTLFFVIGRIWPLQRTLILSFIIFREQHSIIFR